MAIDRINAVKRIVRDKKLDAILFTDLLNIRYLSGYSGSSGMLLITTYSADFFTDFRYKEQSAREVRGAKITIIENSLLDDLSKNAAYIKAKTIGIEEQNLTYGQLLSLQKMSPKKKFVAVGGVAENLRQVKSAEEIGKIAKAAGIADQAFERIVRFIKPGMTESAIAAQLDHILKIN